MLRVPNAALRWVLVGTGALLAIVLLLPIAQGLFHFAPLHGKDLALCIGAGLVCALWFEAVKLGGRWRTRGAPATPPA